MVMSDRIALLRQGELEQVASPRDIYNHPATSYTAQFIGHTNLLRANVKNGLARCGSLSWTVNVPDGPAIFSLRPENIRETTHARTDAISFRGKVLNQAFHGATDLLRVQANDGLIFVIRLASGKGLSSESEFVFSASDAVPVRDSAQPNVEREG
jgi:ABC-type Fe3+/spermidine/putrescine transport system ATPase subunit